MRVPASALNFKPGGPQVAVVGRDGRVEFRDVTIDRDLGDYVEIGSGVSDGEAVALNIGNEVADGEQVEAHEVELAPAGPARGRRPRPRPTAGQAAAMPRLTAGGAPRRLVRPPRTRSESARRRGTVSPGEVERPSRRAPQKTGASRPTPEHARSRALGTAPCRNVAAAAAPVRRHAALGTSAPLP